MAEAVDPLHREVFGLNKDKIGAQKPIQLPEAYDPNVSVGARLGFLNQDPDIVKSTNTVNRGAGFQDLPFGNREAAPTTQQVHTLRSVSGKPVGWNSNVLDQFYPSIKNLPFQQDIRPLTYYANRVLANQRMRAK